MKKRYIVTCSILVLLLFSGAVLNGVRLFFSPGIHKFGNAIHYEVFDSAYIIGSGGRKTNLTFCGTYDGKAYAGGCGPF